MTNFEIVQIIIGSGILAGMVKLIFSAGKFSKSFEEIKDKFNLMEKRFDKIDSRLDILENKIDGVSGRVARLEGAMWRNGTKD